MVAVTLFPTNGKAAAYHVTTSWSGLRGARAATHPGNSEQWTLEQPSRGLVVWAEQLSSLLTVSTAFCLTATATNLFDLTSLKRRQCFVCVSVNADNIIEYG